MVERITAQVKRSAQEPGLIHKHFWMQNLNWNIVNSLEGNGYERPANIKGANKDAKIYVGRSTTMHNFFCFKFMHYAWIT